MTGNEKRIRERELKSLRLFIQQMLETRQARVRKDPRLGSQGLDKPGKRFQRVLT
ncbi:hypothetical protein GCM10007071_22300 [Marinobacter zhanjiangensis]|uniref:Uncharacterized protein n=1 Tax=Marinobacter zhanjiangensis TaxID=578215 RepID=A0ABQ3B296_9GAMM|nr:hypothetical protein GCM10007071_22300 [Marinobacter zhanjiangensis]